MISQKVLDVLLKNGKREVLESVIKEVINHVSHTYDYNDKKANHILEMLADDTAIFTSKDVNLDYIKNNLNLVCYNYEKYNIKDIKINYVDNIECVVNVNYKYIEKTNEDIEENYRNDYTSISYIDYSDVILK